MDVSVILNYLTLKPRNVAIQELEASCQDTAVTILDIHRFSNSSLALQFESKAEGILALDRALEKKAFRASSSVGDERGKVEKAPPGSGVKGTIQVSFMGEDGDMEIEVPMVPG